MLVNVVDDDEGIGRGRECADVSATGVSYVQTRQRPRWGVDPRTRYRHLRQTCAILYRHLVLLPVVLVSIFVYENQSTEIEHMEKRVIVGGVNRRTIVLTVSSGPYKSTTLGTWQANETYYSRHWDLSPRIGTSWCVPSVNGMRGIVGEGRAPDMPNG